MMLKPLPSRDAKKQIDIGEIFSAVVDGNLRKLEDIFKKLDRDEGNRILNKGRLVLRAAEYNNWQILDYLLGRFEPDSCDQTDGFTSPDNDGENLLHILAKRPGNKAIDVLKDHSTLFKNLVNKPDKHGMTPLMTALKRKNTEIAKFLVTQKASFKKVIKGQSAIDFAVKSGQVDLLVIMFEMAGNMTELSKGKDDKLYGKGHTIFFPAAFSGNDEMFTWLENQLGKELVDELLKKELEHKEDSRKFMRKIIGSGMEKFMRKLLELKKLHKKTDYGQTTPLMWAVESNQLKMVKLLLENPSTDTKTLLQERDEKDRNVFHYAAAAKDTEILTYLMGQAQSENTSMFHTKDERGCPPFHYAAVANSFKKVELLLNRNMENTEESIFLCKSCVMKTTDKMLKYILGNIADRNNKDLLTLLGSQNESKWRPVDVAALAGKTVILEELLRKGAKRDAKSDYFSWSILHFAVAGKSLPTVKFIIKESPDMVNWMSNDDETAVVLAAENGSPEILEHILMNGGKVFGDFPKENLLDCVTSDDARNNTPIQNRKETALKIIEFCDGHGGINLLEQLMNNCTDGPQGIMCKLLKQMPSVALEILNRCSDQRESKDFKKNVFQYHFFAIQDKEEKGGETLPAIRTMVKHKCYDCLAHPVVVNFLRMKWFCPGARNLYVGNIILYLIFLISLTIYIGLHAEGSYKLTSPTLTGLSLVSFLVILLNIVKEIMQVIFDWKGYFLDINNYLEWITYISAVIYLMPPTEKKTKVQIEAGAIAVHLAWINFLWFLRRIPRFGIYIIMAKRVLNTVLNVLPMVIVFIFSFAIAFFLLMSDRDDGYKNIPIAMLTTSVMMGGEIDYRDVFLDRSEGPHFFVERLFLLSFLVTMTIVIMNLFVGLAVGDTEKTMKHSKAEKHFYEAFLIVNLQRSLLSIPYVGLSKVQDPLEVDVKVEGNKSQFGQLCEEAFAEVDDFDEIQQISSEIDEVKASIKLLQASMETLLKKIPNSDSNTNPAVDTNVMPNANIDSNDVDTKL